MPRARPGATIAAQATEGGTMNVRSFERWVGLVAVGAALLFLADLFLGWQKVSVEVGGVVGIEQTASGFGGWGIAAAVFAVALVVLELDRLRSGSTTRREAWIVAAGLALIGSTALAVLTGDASVNVQGGAVSVEVGTTLWPAWLGLVLAVIAAGAALAPPVLRARVHGPRGAVTHGHA
jgi:hypothetical protein